MLLLVSICLALGVAVVASLLYILHLKKQTMNTVSQKQPDDVVGSTSSGSSRDSLLKLEDSLSNWQYTFDAISDPVMILDKGLKVVKANQSARQMLAQDGESLEGATCYKLLAGEVVPCRFCPIPVVVQEKKPYSVEIKHNYIGKFLSVTCTPIVVDGEIIGYIHSSIDITRQRQLEKQLVQAHKMDAIATLAGGIAHDFNNILGAILGNADLLLYRLPKDDSLSGRLSGQITFEEINDHIHSIKRAGNRAKELVSQILAFSRQSISKRQQLNIAPLIKESCKLLRSSLPATIEFKVSISSDTGPIYADPGQIQQVLMNLTNNAAQALENNTGTIEISLREIEAGTAEQKSYPDLNRGKYVVLSVRDTGRGIPEEVLQRIFDPFFTTRDVGDGSGMGLAVLHGIILAHEGVIDVKSKVGKGTQFMVFFPLVKEEHKDEEDIITAMPRGKETILFVDDEEEIVTMRTRMLEYLGYRVLPATSPEKALEFLASGTQQVDLLITDQTMPRMTGIQLAEKALQYHPDLPVILCSGYSDAVSPEEAREAGVKRFLAKPLDMRLLAVAIREILPSNNGSNHENTGH